jgi:hypothetical protein
LIVKLSFLFTAFIGVLRTIQYQVFYFKNQLRAGAVTAIRRWGASAELRRIFVALRIRTAEQGDPVAFCYPSLFKKSTRGFSSFAPWLFKTCSVGWRKKLPPPQRMSYPAR